MPEHDLVLFDRSRAVLPGITLPDPPPTRVSISGHQYRLTAPRVALPPIINVARLVLNWANTYGKVAKNILHVQMSGGTGSTSDTTWLNALANQVMTSWATSNISSKLQSIWNLQSVTAKDAGGTTAQSTSTAVAIVGGDSGTPLPPGVSVAISWQIVDAYRGGKPRTYLPGIPNSALASGGDSTLSGTYANQLDTAATLFMTDLNSHTVSGSTIKLGVVSYYSGHAVRPTPLFRAFFGVKIHERVDSQRRRNGREASYPVTP